MHLESSRQRGRENQTKRDEVAISRLCGEVDGAIPPHPQLSSGRGGAAHDDGVLGLGGSLLSSLSASARW